MFGILFIFSDGRVSQCPEPSAMRPTLGPEWAVSGHGTGLGGECFALTESHQSEA